MARIYYKAFESLTVTATAGQDIWSLMANAANKVRLLAFEMTSSATAANNVACRIHKISAVGSGGSAPGGEEAADDVSTATATIRTLDTTGGTDAGGIQGFEWEQQGPVSHVYGDRAPTSKVSEGFAFTWDTAVGATLSGFVCWEEI